jgi:hypothetical protein
MQPSEQSAVADDNVALVLADGKMVLRDGRVVSEVPKSAALVSREIESGRAASRTLQRMHRKLGDHPDIPQKMNPVAAVILYTCIGLNDEDIATALQATPAQIATIKDSELYGQLFKLFDRTVFEDAKQNARHIIAKATDHAAEVMVNALDSDDPLIKLSASREVMKLGGVSLEEKNERAISGLHIRITRKEDEADEISIGVQRDG